MTNLISARLCRLFLASIYLFGWTQTFGGHPRLGIGALIYYLYRYTTTFNKECPFVGQNIHMHSSTITCATLEYGLDFPAWAIFDEEPQSNHDDTADVKSHGQFCSGPPEF